MHVRYILDLCQIPEIPDNKPQPTLTHMVPLEAEQASNMPATCWPSQQFAGCWTQQQPSSRPLLSLIGHTKQGCSCQACHALDNSQPHERPGRQQGQRNSTRWWRNLAVLRQIHLVPHSQPTQVLGGKVQGNCCQRHSHEQRPACVPRDETHTQITSSSW